MILYSHANLVEPGAGLHVFQQHLDLTAKDGCPRLASGPRATQQHPCEFVYLLFFSVAYDFDKIKILRYTLGLIMAQQLIWSDWGKASVSFELYPRNKPTTIVFVK
jgi:hypothetical protein